MLTRMEEIVLLAVWRLKDNAYGLTVQDCLSDILGKEVSSGTAYVPLSRLSKRGYLRTHEGEPTNERGGRRKRFYQLTPKGVRALTAARALHESAWEGVSIAALGRVER